MIAILDIDEVIQLIRSSDDATRRASGSAGVFDLSPRRRPTTSSRCAAPADEVLRIELEKEQTELEPSNRRLDAILGDEALLRQVVSDELAEVAKTYGTPRRTVLLESAGTRGHRRRRRARGRRRPLLRAAASTGLLARTAGAEPVGSGDGRANHDVVVSAVAATVRGEVGVLTSAGRLVRLGVLDLPSIPPAPTTRTCRAGCRSPRCSSLAPGERALALCTPDRRGARPRARHPPGRRQAGQPRGARPRRLGGDRPQGRRRGRRRRRARHRRGDAVLRHLRRPAAALRRDRWCGRRAAPAAAWPASSWPPVRAGRLVRGASTRAAPEGSVVVTASGSSTALPGTEPGRSRSRPSPSTPPRAGPPAASAATASCRARTPWSSPGSAPPPPARPPPAAPRSTLPEADGRRDGSGVPASQPVAACAGPLAARLATAGVEG